MLVGARNELFPWGKCGSPCASQAFPSTPISEEEEPDETKAAFQQGNKESSENHTKVSKNMRKTFPYEEAERVSWAIVMEEGVGEEGENHTINMETTDLKGGTFKRMISIRSITYEMHVFGIF